MKLEHRSRKQRAKQRGAVTIEAVMVISVLMLAFAGGIFFHGLFAAKMKANRDARLDVWTRAVKGCTSKLEGGDSLFDLSGKPPLDEVDTSSPPGFFQVGHVNTTMSAGPVKTPGLLAKGGGQAAYTLSSHQQVACNDRIQSEKDGVLKKIGSAIGTLVGSFL